MGKLDKRVAIITGGARGMGKQMALTFAKEGADIVIGDVIEMESTAQEVRRLGRGVITVRADVTKKAEVENLAGAAIKKFKKIDVLVNNAGIMRSARMVEMREEDWDAVLDVNLKGVFLCTQAVARHMIEQKYGKIINMASMAGVGSSSPGQTSYATSKAGVIQFTKVCALELGPYGINVNAIAPGVVKTEILYSQKSPEEVNRFISERAKQAALGRVGTPEDIANIALFLASEDSSFITGHVVAANGGRF
ncbi:MAG: SDR family NAD(P)-dependent oxidoreductase [Thermodesulfobacteriota bacterium]